MLALPESGRVACWLNAWLTGRHSADTVIDGLLGDKVAVEFCGLQEEALSAALLLGALRERRVTRVTVALPVPGDPLGLGGPTAFNTAAHEAGEAVLLQGADLGLLPQRTERRTRWSASTAHVPSYAADVMTAGRELRDALRTAADELAALDVASWSPEFTDGLLNLRSPASFQGLMTFASASAEQTAASAARCRLIVEMASADDGGALSASEAARRRHLLDPLDRAARRALVAVCSSLDGR